ncbi:AAA family ATPase [Sorangium sp. So ce176]|uniref:AAA family ATPase n=1 Tax=Sorangium sp. So ce176 TaxID=3133286 RepID=UPI003F601F96
MKTLVLPSTYEDIKSYLASTGAVYAAKLMEFVRPIEDTERDLTQMTTQLRGTSGRAVLLYGPPGTGKSTFIESLTWRTHVGVSDLQQIDCARMQQEQLLDELIRQLQMLAERVRGSGRVTAVAINYLEDLEGQDEGKVRAFFRSLNGLLRTSPLFIIWPVTDLEDARKMLDYASAVSGTVFFPGREILTFHGPAQTAFVSIAKNTIAVLNDGQTLEEFGLTEAGLEEIASRAVHPTPTLRSYLDAVVEQWRNQSGYLEDLQAKIPKPTEVWTIFAYPDAESVIGQFSRRSEQLEEVWTAFHSKLWEYIPNSQRAADWNPKRLQLAISGALRTRIMYMPTNAIVSTFAAYAQDKAKTLNLSTVGVPDRWAKQSSAQKHIKTSPLHRLLMGQQSPPGKRKSGPAARAAETAEKAFNEISKYASGTGNDRHINHALANVLRDVLPKDYVVESEKAHPWIPNITPDIRVDTPDNRLICVELCYTSAREPYVVADYVLKKLDRYMRQLEYYVGDVKAG